MTARQGLPRSLEVAVTGTALVVLAPLLATVAVLVRVSSPGPVVYRQVRVGCGGAPFTLLKFRTMSVAGEVSRQLTVGEDPRITRVGRWLRRHKLDELPQLVNVLRGDMALVGPRPEVPEFVSTASPLQREVLKHRPGLTDPASLAFRDEAAVLAAAADPVEAYTRSILPAKLELSVAYLQQRSMLTDIRVLIDTLSCLVRAQAAPAEQGSATAPPPVRTRVLRGRDALRESAAALDALQALTGCPVTARRPWQQVWLDSWPEASALLVLVEREGVLVAAAPLACLPGRGRCRRVVPIGAGPSDDVRLPSVDAQARALLVAGIVAALQSLGAPWRLELERLAADDPLIPALLRGLPRSASSSGEPSPETRLGDDRAVRRYTSRNHHQQVRRTKNLLQREGVEWQCSVLREAGDVAAVLPDLEQLARARAAMAGRRSDLDDEFRRRFFLEVLLELARRDELRLTALNVGSTLAAYVVCFRDGTATRMWSCGFDPRWGRFGIGRLALHLSLEQALADDDCVVFDWMRGTEDYKAQLATSSRAAADVFGWSSWWVRAVDEPPRRLRLMARAALAERPALRRQVSRLRTARVRRRSRA